MSRSVNEVILIGHVGRDPEIRATSSGSRVASVSLATNHSYKGDARTDWHRLKLFGRLVDVVEEFVTKGDRLYVRGRIEYSSSESSQGTRYWTDIIVNDLVMLGGESRPEPEGDLPDGSTRESNRFQSLPF